MGENKDIQRRYLLEKLQDRVEQAHQLPTKTFTIELSASQQKQNGEESLVESTRKKRPCRARIRPMVWQKAPRKGLPFKITRKRPRPEPLSKLNNLDLVLFPAKHCEKIYEQSITNKSYLIESKKGPSLVSRSPRDISRARTRLNSTVPASSLKNNKQVLGGEAILEDDIIEKDNILQTQLSKTFQGKGFVNKSNGTKEIGASMLSTSEPETEENITENSNTSTSNKIMNASIFGLTEATYFHDSEEEATLNSEIKESAVAKIEEGEQSQLERFFKLSLEDQIKILNSENAEIPVYSSQGRLKAQKRNTNKMKQLQNTEEITVPNIQNLDRIKGEVGKLPKVLMSEIDVLGPISFREETLLNLRGLYNKLIDTLMDTNIRPRVSAKEKKARSKLIRDMQRDMSSLIKRIRLDTIKVVKTIVAWRETIAAEEIKRASNSKKYSFMYLETNYLIKMEHDLEFLNGEDDNEGSFSSTSLSLIDKKQNNPKDANNLSNSDVKARENHELYKWKRRGCAELVSRWFGFSVKGNPLLCPPEGLDVKKALIQQQQEFERELSEQRLDDLKRRIHHGLCEGHTAKYIFSPCIQVEHDISFKNNEKKSSIDLQLSGSLNLLSIDRIDENDQRFEIPQEVSSARCGFDTRLSKGSFDLDRMNIRSARTYEEDLDKHILESRDCQDSVHNYVGSGFDSAKPNLMKGQTFNLMLSEFVPEEQLVTDLLPELLRQACETEKVIKDEVTLIEKSRKEAELRSKELKNGYDPIIELHRRGGVPRILEEIESKTYEDQDNAIKAIAALSRRQQEGQDTSKDETLSLGIGGKPIGKPGPKIESLRSLVRLGIEKEILHQNMKDKEARQKLVTRKDVEFFSLGKKRRLSMSTISANIDESARTTNFNIFEEEKDIPIIHQNHRKKMGIFCDEDDTFLNCDTSAARLEICSATSKENEAAKLIQSIFRRNITRSSVRGLLESERLIGKNIPGYNELNASAIIIQAQVRRLIACKKVQMREADILMEKQEKEKQDKKRSKQQRYEHLKERGRQRRLQLMREADERHEALAKELSLKSIEAKKMTKSIQDILSAKQNKKSSATFTPSKNVAKMATFQRSASATKIQAVVRGAITKSRYNRDKEREAQRTREEENLYRQSQECVSLYTDHLDQTIPENSKVFHLENAESNNYESDSYSETASSDSTSKYCSDLDDDIEPQFKTVDDLLSYYDTEIQEEEMADLDDWKTHSFGVKRTSVNLPMIGQKISSFRNQNYSEAHDYKTRKDQSATQAAVVKLPKL